MSVPGAAGSCETPPIVATRPGSPSAARPGRRQIERQVQAARHEALTWTGSPLNAERVGTYLRSYGATAAGSRRPRGQTLGDYTALLTEWSVPGVVPPPDLDATTGAMWSRSVTLAVLQYLRRHGHLG